MSEAIQLTRYASGVAEDKFTLDRESGDLSFDRIDSFAPSDRAYPLWEAYVPELDHTFEFECAKADVPQTLATLVEEHTELLEDDVDVDLEFATDDC